MKNKSFTLIELLVVIVIIGILAGVIIVSVSSSIDKANFAKAQAFSNTVQNELLGDLVSEWTFNEDNVVGVAKDTWGDNHGNVLAGSPEFLTGSAKGECVFGGCVQFDGTDNINLVRSSLNNVSNWTISFWVKENEGGYIYSEGNQALTFSLGITIDGKISVGSWNYDYPGWWLYATSDVIMSNASEWNYVVLSLVDGGIGVGDLNYYINGQLKATKISQKEHHSGSKYAMIGDNIGAYYISPQGHAYFKGFLDEFRIYNVSLSTSQIKQQYIAGLNSLLAKGSISKEEYEQGLNNLAYEK